MGGASKPLILGLYVCCLVTFFVWYQSRDLSRRASRVMSGNLLRSRSSSSAVVDDSSSSTSFSSFGKKPAEEEAQVLVSCPASMPAAGDWSDYNQAEVKAYGEEQQELITSNLTYYAENFRTLEYDLWTYSYNEFKETIYDWKTRHFASVKSGDSMYESASGIGLNLLMVTEILRDEHNVQNLTIYGNEYLESSVRIANDLFDTGIYPESTKKGSLCRGDSANLTHVPSNAFDLVFTGYISPVWDPMGQGDDWMHRLKKMCKELRHEASYARKKSIKRRIRKMQHVQEKWYNKWVKEMIRIAKPGATIVVESISRPFCDAYHDFGGVDPTFWQRQVDESDEWPIVPDSLVMEDDKMFHEFRRYHVAMQKLS